jgi:hypothetical protein
MRSPAQSTIQLRSVACPPDHGLAHSSETHDKKAGLTAQPAGSRALESTAQVAPLPRSRLLEHPAQVRALQRLKLAKREGQHARVRQRVVWPAIGLGRESVREDVEV